MGAGKVVVDPNHAMVLAGIAFIGGDQFSGSIPIVRAVRRRDQVEKRLYQRIDWDGDTPAGSSVRAGGRMTSGGQQSLMGKGIGHRGDCSRSLYLPKSFIVYKEEGVIMLQRPSDPSTELIADKLRDRTGGQIEIVLRVQ